MLSDTCTHLTRVEPVQAVFDPLLHVQPPLQLLPVVLHGDPGMSLRDVTPVLRRKIWWINVVMFLQRRAGPIGCHYWSGLVWLVSRRFFLKDSRGERKLWWGATTAHSAGQEGSGYLFKHGSTLKSRLPLKKKKRRGVHFFKECFVWYLLLLFVLRSDNTYENVRLL